jgi:hypothetical protein
MMSTMWTHIGLIMSVCPSARIIQLENCWTDFDEVWFKYYAIRGYRIVAHFNFLKSVFTNMSEERTCEVEATLAPFNIG